MIPARVTASPAGPATESTGETIRFTSVNWDYGGMDDGSDARWEQSVEALRQVRPQVVLCQEFGVPQPALWLARHVRRTASALGMEPIVGPVVPGARTALHIAVLVDTASTGWRIDDEGPYPGAGSAGTAHAWCHVELRIPGLARPLHCYSVHLPARSAVAQLSEAQSLGALVAEQPQLALIGGDFNGYARGGPPVTSNELAALPGHLRVSHCRNVNGGGRDGGGGAEGRLEPNFDVDDVLVRAGLVDIPAHLPETRRDPPGLRATGRGGARVDRFYGSPELAAAAVFYRHLTIGSDHDGLLLDVDLASLVRAASTGVGDAPARPDAPRRTSSPPSEPHVPSGDPGFPGFPTAC